jgi:hypothetical protein
MRQEYFTKKDAATGGNIDDAAAKSVIQAHYLKDQAQRKLVERSADLSS